MVDRVEKGTLNLTLSNAYRGAYTTEEIAALSADPLCVLQGRNLRSQWKKCRQLGFRRHESLRPADHESREVRARRRARISRDLLNGQKRRKYFRNRVRENPGPFLDELRRLAKGHQCAEDLVEEGFATMLRLAIPAAEAFKLAKAEVNRTSAQPFREQSFNPDIDYAARESGRQVARASDLRAARGEG